MKSFFAFLLIGALSLSLFASPAMACGLHNGSSGDKVESGGE